MADLNQRRARKPEQLGGFDKFRSGLLADTGLTLVEHERRGWRFAQPFEVLEQHGASLTVMPPDDGVATVRYAGLVDQQFLQVGHAWSEGSSRFVARAVVLDFQQAEIRFQSTDLDAALCMLWPEQQARPRALLVPPAHAGMFKAFALRAAAQLAICQRGFFDRAAAEVWARETAARHGA